jgi:hypothetical protein
MLEIPYGTTTIDGEVTRRSTKPLRRYPEPCKRPQVVGVAMGRNLTRSWSPVIG